MDTTEGRSPDESHAVCADADPRRTLTRRQMLKLAGGTVAVAALAACGAQQPAQPQPTQPQATEAPGGATQPQTTEAPVATQPPSQARKSLRLWSSDNQSFVQTNEKVVNRYQEASPDVEIKYEYFPYDQLIQTIQTAMAAKNEADVMEMFGSWVPSYAKGGTLSEAPADVMTLQQAQELFYAAPMDGYVYQGKVYGLPNEYNLENGAALVNKTMYEKAGVTYPPTWNTWDDLVTDAKKLTQWDGDVMKVAGFHYVNPDGLGFLFWEGILERGGDYWATDKIHLNLETDQAVATTQWLADMAIKDKVVDPVTFNPNSNWIGDSFFQGLVAIGFIGPWIVPLARINHPEFPDQWGYISTPYYGDKMSFAADSGWGKVVSPNSKELPTAWDIAKFWTSDAANARAWNVGTGTVPALKTVAEDPSLLTDLDWLGPSLKVLPFGRFVGDLQDRDYVWYNVLATRLTETLQGQHTAQEVCKIMNDECNAMIDSKLKGS
jgi:multiple sugar transport system substrate-binding protein